MTIPQKIKIGNLTYSVRLLNKEEDHFDYGRIVSSTQTIGISGTASKEQREQAFFHEIVHAILGEGKYDEENRNEKLVQCLAAGIYQVLNDNNLLKDGNHQIFGAGQVVPKAGRSQRRA